MPRVANFKYNENTGDVTLKITTERANGKTDTDRLECTDQPKVELEKQLQKFNKHARDFAELPDEWEDKIIVRGITISYGKKGRMGIVIRVARELEGSRTPLSINTPFHQEEWDDGEEGEKNPEAEKSVFGSDCKNDVEELERLVLAYWKGDRVQRALPFKDEESDDAGESDELDLGFGDDGAEESAREPEVIGAE